MSFYIWMLAYEYAVLILLVAVGLLFTIFDPTDTNLYAYGTDFIVGSHFLLLTTVTLVILTRVILAAFDLPGACHLRFWPGDGYDVFSLHRQRPKALQQACSDLFAKLPTEVRCMIYRELLLTASEIGNPTFLTDHTRSLIVPHGRTNRFDVEATILRTCRRIYEEAFPILYRENTYTFTTAEALKTFRCDGLDRVELRKLADPTRRLYWFNLNPAKHGRLTMLRKLKLDFTSAHTPATRRPPQAFLRNRSMFEWFSFYTETKLVESHSYITFPVLEDLTLEFTSWNLRQGEGILTQPLIHRFSQHRRLKRLEIIGVPCERSLNRLKDSLLEDGGHFVVT